MSGPPPDVGGAAMGANLKAESKTLCQVTIAFLVMSWLSVALRVYVRAGLMKSFGWDDATLVLSQCLNTVLCALTLAIAQMQPKLYHATPELLMKLQTLLRVVNGAYALTVITVRISLLIFFLKIFVKKWQRILPMVLIALSTIFGLVFLFVEALTCAIQTTSFATNTCPQETAFLGLAAVWGILNPINDLAFALLSVIAIWTVKMRLSGKISAAALLIFGCFGGVASCIRVGVVLAAIGSTDPAYNLVVGRWSNVEAGICISAAALVTLRPLARAIRERFWPNGPRTGSENINSTARAQAGREEMSAWENVINQRKHHAILEIRREREVTVDHEEMDEVPLRRYEMA